MARLDGFPKSLVDLQYFPVHGNEVRVLTRQNKALARAYAGNGARRVSVCLPAGIGMRSITHVYR